MGSEKLITVRGDDGKEHPGLVVGQESTGELVVIVFYAESGKLHWVKVRPDAPAEPPAPAADEVG
jgi:hypothetical protein